LLALARDWGLIDEAVDYDRRGSDRGLRGLWRAARRIRAHRPRRALIFPPSFRAALLAFLSACPRRRGFPGDGRRFLLDDPYRAPQPPRSRHQARVWRAMAKGEALSEREPAQWGHLGAGESARAALAELRQRVPELAAAGGYAVLAPAVRYGPAKQWPASYFHDLAQKIIEELQLQVVVVAGAGPEEAQVAAVVNEGLGILNLAGRTDLLALSALLQEAALFVGNDSGPAHLAAAVGTTTLTIFGSTNPDWTAPLGERARIVGPHPVPCTPCYRKLCPIGLPCLKELTVEKVWETVLELRRGENAKRV
jgi:heptosyltransferase-2